MLKPHKYFNLEFSVFHISALIIQKLLQHKLLKYDELYNFLLATKGENIKDVFPIAINFLFLLNKIEYHQQIDTFELI